MDQYWFDSFSFNPATGELLNQSETNPTSVQLRFKICRLLQYLIENRDRVVSKEELLEKLWQHGDFRENSLTQSIRELRKALGDKAQSPKFVKTYQQRGYQWICPVEVEQAKPAVSHSNHPEKVKPKAQKNYKAIVLASASLLVLLSLITLGYFSSTTEPLSEESNQPSLMVLPLINETGNDTMDWLELGLADMIAMDMHRSGLVQITPPSIASNLLLGAELQWPTLPVHIRSLMLEQGLDRALIASVHNSGQQQELKFQLLSSDGKVTQGTMRYASLPAAIPAISKQLLHLLIPDTQQLDNSTIAPPSEEQSLAMQALAEGIHTLHTLGPMHAKKYFQAAKLLTTEAHWTTAYLAQSELLTGNWTKAEEMLLKLKNKGTHDHSLTAFIEYWLAELAYRKGDKQRLQSYLFSAILSADLAKNARIQAQSYRLQAKVFWNEMNWEKHRYWLNKANRLFPSTNNNLSIEAEKLFFLGAPINIGLEKDPQNNLLLNQARLEKALNFYSQLGNQPMKANALFAIAQNYQVDYQQRMQALQQTIQLYRQLNQPYQLAQALAYKGFIHIQGHDGANAISPLQEALTIANKLGAQRLQDTISFYYAFAKLDQGLDQSTFGKHGRNESELQEAIHAFKVILQKPVSKITRANTYIMLGWAYGDLGQHQLALKFLKEAKQLNRELGMDTTFGYSSFSMMRIYLALKQYKKVIELADDKFTTRQQYTYLARAHYELGEFKQAAKVLNALQDANVGVWLPDDEERLQIYSNTSQTGIKAFLKDEPVAHAVYCESDWFNKK